MTFVLSSKQGHLPLLPMWETRTHHHLITWVQHCHLRHKSGPAYTWVCTRTSFCYIGLRVYLCSNNKLSYISLKKDIDMREIKFFHFFLFFNMALRA